MSAGCAAILLCVYHRFPPTDFIIPAFSQVKIMVRTCTVTSTPLHYITCVTSMLGNLKFSLCRPPSYSLEIFLTMIFNGSFTTTHDYLYAFGCTGNILPCVIMYNGNPLGAAL